MSTCGCFGPTIVPERLRVWNDPGRQYLSYRIAVHGSFRQAMLSGLSTSLPQHTTRDEDDLTIAWASAWASVLDVLTFYQERIANEAFLRTATERRSVLELARSVGYELGPGLAASTYLAFTVETAIGSPSEVRLDVGTQAQSQPGQDETPQVFETIEVITARGALNSLRPVHRGLIPPGTGSMGVTLKGRDTRLKPGDAILVVGDELKNYEGSDRWNFRRVVSVTPDDEMDVTRITWGSPLSVMGQDIVAHNNVKVYALRSRANLFGYNAPSLKTMKEVAVLGKSDAITPRQHGGESGAAKQETAQDGAEWEGFNIAYKSPIPQETGSVYLDAAYPQIAKGSLVVLCTPMHSEIFEVLEAVEDGLSMFTLSGRATRLKLKGENLLSNFGAQLRATQVYGESVELPLGEDRSPPLEGDLITLTEGVEGLEVGRYLAIVGTINGTKTPYSDIRQIAGVNLRNGRTEIQVTVPLPALDAESVFINANVATATHGESTRETLGSGNSILPGQTFALKRSPLTFVGAESASGVASTLQVRVNDILWNEVPTLYDVVPQQRAYAIRITDEGTALVVFGNGKCGARLPSGVDNVKAVYRSGIGLGGLVQTGQISMLLSRPLGLKEVTNPIAPTDAADPESINAARENAPKGVLTLDRVVSLLDYESFARSFAGVAKAQVSKIWDGHDRVVHVTMVGENGAPISADSPLIRRLRQAINGASHQDHKLSLATCESLKFVVEARILPDPAFIAAKVIDAAKKKLMESFGFKARQIGCSVALSDVLAVLQSTPGVIAAQIDAFNMSGTPRKRKERLMSFPARFESGQIRPGQLLTIDEAEIHITEMKQ